MDRFDILINRKMHLLRKKRSEEKKNRILREAGRKKFPLPAYEMDLLSTFSRNLMTQSVRSEN